MTTSHDTPAASLRRLLAGGLVQAMSTHSPLSARLAGIHVQAASFLDQRNRRLRFNQRQLSEIGPRVVRTNAVDRPVRPDVQPHGFRRNFDRDPFDREDRQRVAIGRNSTLDARADIADLPCDRLDGYANDRRAPDNRPA